MYSLSHTKHFTLVVLCIFALFCVLIILAQHGHPLSSHLLAQVINLDLKSQTGLSIMLLLVFGILFLLIYVSSLLFLILTRLLLLYLLLSFIKSSSLISSTCLFLLSHSTAFTTLRTDISGTDLAMYSFIPLFYFIDLGSV